MVVLGICIFICCKKKILAEYLVVELLYDGVCVYLTFLNCDKYFQSDYSILCSTKSSDNIIVHHSWCCLLLKLVFYMVSLGVSPFKNVSFIMSVCSVCLWVCVYVFVCVWFTCVWACVCHGTLVEVSRECVIPSSLLPPCGFSDSNSNVQL